MLVFIVTDPNDQIIGAYSTIQAAAAAVREHPGSELLKDLQSGARYVYSYAGLSSRPG